MDSELKQQFYEKYIELLGEGLLLKLDSKEINQLSSEYYIVNWFHNVIFTVINKSLKNLEDGQYTEWYFVLPQKGKMTWTEILQIIQHEARFFEDILDFGNLLATIKIKDTIPSFQISLIEGNALEYILKTYINIIKKKINNVGYTPVSPISVKRSEYKDKRIELLEAKLAELNVEVPASEKKRVSKK